MFFPHFLVKGEKNERIPLVVPRFWAWLWPVPAMWERWLRWGRTPSGQDISQDLEGFLAVIATLVDWLRFKIIYIYIYCKLPGLLTYWRSFSVFKERIEGFEHSSIWINIGVSENGDTVSSSFMSYFLTKNMTDPYFCVQLAQFQHLQTFQSQQESRHHDAKDAAWQGLGGMNTHPGETALLGAILFES